MSDMMQGHRTGNGKLLGTYSLDDVRESFKKCGILKKLAKHGYTEVTMAIDDSDPFVHRLIISDHSIENLPEGHNFLIDMFVRRRDGKVEEFKCYSNNHLYEDVSTSDSKKRRAKALKFMEKGLEGDGSPLKVSIIEWVRMQDPRADFKAGLKALPGQFHPGLGVSRDFHKIVSYFLFLLFYLFSYFPSFPYRHIIIFTDL